MIKITPEIAEDIISFIQPRPTVPKDVETIIVEKHRQYYLKQLIGKEIKDGALDKFKTTLENAYLNSLIQPGETVGIICGQCIGERTTQSSLNNFHSAGLDTGSTSCIDSLQNIINASKPKKKELRKFFRVSLFLNSSEMLSLKEIKKRTIQYLEEVKFSQLIDDIEYKNISLDNIPEIFGMDNHKDKSIVKFSINLEKIYSYNITRKQLLSKIPCQHKFCMPYSMISEDAFTIDLYCFLERAEYDSIFDFIKLFRDVTVIGIEGVQSHVFSQKNTGEWYIDCLCSSIYIFFMYSHIYNINKIICNSVIDMFQHFGILAAQELIIEKCKEIIPDIDTSHFKILAMCMTKNGIVEPLTRYTMRNNNSPLTKASFEESFETFIKACKFNEKEKFKSISSAIICGKKPQIGTYQSSILMDPSFFK